MWKMQKKKSNVLSTASYYLHIATYWYTKVKASAYNHLQISYDVDLTLTQPQAHTEECTRATSLAPTQIHLCSGTCVNYYRLSVSFSQTLHLLLLSHCLLSKCTSPNTDCEDQHVYCSLYRLMLLSDTYVIKPNKN